jgi:acyl dehydratase
MKSKSKQNGTFKVDCSVQIEKKVTESDVLQFAKLTGDFSPNHIDEEYMKNTSYKKRIAHGALLVGYMSNASTKILENFPLENPNVTAVSLGYDKVRFIKPVFIDDTITITYRVVEIDNNKNRSYSSIEITNQEGAIVAVATHILCWVPNH